MSDGKKKMPADATNPSNTLQVKDTRPREEHPFRPGPTDEEMQKSKTYSQYRPHFNNPPPTGPRTDEWSAIDAPRSGQPATPSIAPTAGSNHSNEADAPTPAELHRAAEWARFQRSNEPYAGSASVAATVGSEAGEPHGGGRPPVKATLSYSGKKREKKDSTVTVTLRRKGSRSDCGGEGGGGGRDGGDGSAAF